MKLNHIYKSACLLVLLVTVSSCEKDFLEVNEDPNRSRNSSVDIVLPSALGYTSYSFGNQYQILGGFWAQYWTQGPTANQYNSLDRYVITSDSYSRPWSDLYAGPLLDYQYIVEEGTKAGQPNYVAIAKLMQAYTFQALTDMYGDIPFSEALKGSPESGDNIAPAYDSQEEVYNGLITLVDDAISLIDTDSDKHPHGDDFVYEGDMEQWLRFANTLKLRIYLRQSEVRPDVAAAGIRALYASGAEFLEADAEVLFYDATFNRNPLYATFQALGTSNILASNTVLSYLEENNDPRIGAFFTEATTGTAKGQYNGLDQGEGKTADFGSSVAGTDFSKPSEAIIGPTSPVVLMSVAESYFLQAEAVARGWGNGNAAELYTSGIEASFEKWGLEKETADYLAQPAVTFPAAGGVEEQIRAIITQKWVSMTGTEHVEPWSEWRRTGYPDFFTVSLDTQIGNEFPARILYPSSEETRNPNVPAQKTVKDRVWWDVKANN